MDHVERRLFGELQEAAAIRRVHEQLLVRRALTDAETTTREAVRIVKLVHHDVSWLWTKAESEVDADSRQVAITHDCSAIGWNRSLAAITFEKSDGRTTTVNRRVVSVPDTRVRMRRAEQVAQFVSEDFNRPRISRHGGEEGIDTAIAFAYGSTRAKTVYGCGDTAGVAHGEKVSEVSVEGSSDLLKLRQDRGTRSQSGVRALHVPN